LEEKREEGRGDWEERHRDFGAGDRSGRQPKELWKEEMEDLGIEAKEAAVREVAKILPLPELLASIASIKSDYLSRQQASLSPIIHLTSCSSSFSKDSANDAQLSTMVAEQDVGGMMSISVEAAAAHDSLSDDKELIHTYEFSDDIHVHREYFEDVDRTWETFEKTLWIHIANFFNLAKESSTYCLLRSLVEHSCINSNSPTFGYLDEKSIDTGLMKFSGFCPSALS
ncbi:hypothetical protein BHE74_00019995, partial [Ensete ventricosum]